MLRGYVKASTRSLSAVRVIPLLMPLELSTHFFLELGEWVKIPTTYAGGAKGMDFSISVVIYPLICAQISAILIWWNVCPVDALI
jgi:hypothetical protein